MKPDLDTIWQFFLAKQQRPSSSVERYVAGGFHHLLEHWETLFSAVLGLSPKPEGVANQHAPVAHRDNIAVRPDLVVPNIYATPTKAVESKRQDEL